MENDEPIYENIVRIDNVQIIDHRIIRIMNRVHEAPKRIQEETDKFIRYIDSLKKSYVKSIVKRRDAERRYSEAIANYEACEQEYKTYQQDYLVLFKDDIDEVAKRLEQHHIELVLARNILDSAERELVLHREQLFLLSNKAEHRYINFLRKTADKCWADMYMHDLGEYEDDLKPPQFIYKQDLLQTETTGSDQSEEYVTSEEGFEWDTTYDEHLHSQHDLPTQSGHTPTTNYRKYYDDNEYSDNENDDYKNIVDIDEFSESADYGEKAKLYSPEPLYDDWLIYRRRCFLIQLMKPTRLIRYLKNKVHGPWEGWEDL